jgi:hypothetical protein
VLHPAKSKVDANLAALTIGNENEKTPAEELRVTLPQNLPQLEANTQSIAKAIMRQLMFAVNFKSASS